MISLRLAVVLIAIVALARSHPGTRIVNGSPATSNQFPYQASYQVNEVHHCGAAILTRYWLVTAAHCLVGNPEDNRIVAGLLNLGEVNNNVQILTIAQQIAHPQFTGGVAPFDIGLIQLEYPLYWTYAVQPIDLPGDQEEFNGYAWVSGWGALDSSSNTPSTALQGVQMNILAEFDCADRLTQVSGTSAPLDITMVCGVGIAREDQSICTGDDGGPMQKDNILVGVASWTVNPCDTIGAPSVFTKVSRYLEFIRQYVPNV